MRYSTAEKREIIRLVEESDVPIQQTLAELGIARSTFYDWYKRYRQAGSEGLARQSPHPHQFWNRIPQSVQQQVVDLALQHPDQSPRQLAWTFTDQEQYFISESSVYRILKRLDLVTSPAFQVIAARDHFEHPTTRVNEPGRTFWLKMNLDMR